MRQIIYLAFIVLLATSCKKDAELTVLKSATFKPTAAASTPNVVLTAKVDGTNVLTVSWEKAIFPVEAPVSYTLQFDLLSDVNGATPWANAQQIVVGNDILSKSILGADLNNLAIALGLPYDSVSKVQVRIKATMDRDIYSNTFEITIKPYKVFTGYPLIYIAGAFQGWNIGAASSLASMHSNTLYEGYINVPTGANSGSYQLKLYAELGNWNSTSWGTPDGTSTLVVANFAGDNIQLPSAGYYELGVDFASMTWAAYPVSWSILGDATPGGWATDTQMNYDATNQVWTVTANMLKNGSFKFRANNDWKNDFGLDADGKLAYADNQVYGYTAGINNITVPSDGNYTIILDLHNPGIYTYSLKKN